MKSTKLLNKLRLQAPPMAANYTPPSLPGKPIDPQMPPALKQWASNAAFDGYTTENYLLNSSARLWAISGFGPENKAEILAQARVYDQAMSQWGHENRDYHLRNSIYQQAAWADTWARQMVESWGQIETERLARDFAPGGKYYEDEGLPGDGDALLVTTFEQVDLGKE